jgi:hypothetical protein
MARYNKIQQNFLQKINRQIKHRKIHIKTEESDEKKNWTTFTYYSTQIWKTTILLKHTNIGIALKNTNTLQQLTKPKTQYQITELLYIYVHTYI